MNSLNTQMKRNNTKFIKKSFYPETTYRIMQMSPYNDIMKMPMSPFRIMYPIKPVLNILNERNKTHL